MPSLAYRNWNTIRARELDEIEAIHALVGGAGRGHRLPTQQLNRAYAVLLASQFQGFCRDLHTETADCLVLVIPHLGFQEAMKQHLLWNRHLDRGNAHQTSIGGDYRRFGIPDFWARIDAVRVGNDQRRLILDVLNEWRNAIAHQDLDPARLGGTISLHLRVVGRWRRACRLLARSMDEVMRDHISSVTGTAPW